jgi:hypothetical protein
MTSLEHELRSVAPALDWPAERDLAPAVRARIGGVRPRRRGALVLAFALVVLGVAIAFAVPPARSEILDWLGIGTARVELVDELPDVPVTGRLYLGPRTSLADARKAVTYHVQTSPLLGTPKEVHRLGDQIAFVYGNKLVVLQTRGMFFTKEVGPGTNVEPVLVKGERGIWISGSEHFFGYIGGTDGSGPVQFYLAGNALLWQDDELTLRLEGDLTRAQALEIARSFR